MKVRIYPGDRNDCKIEQVKTARALLHGEEWEQWFYQRMDEDDDWLDAMYYASGNDAEAILARWEDYMTEELYENDKPFLAGWLCGIDN